jgi:hypothetical protein
MPDLYLPQSSRAAIEADRAEIALQYMSVRGALDHYNPMLKRIDERLELVRAHDQVAEGSPMKAGYYHILLHAPGHPTTVLPLEYDDGSYREPGSWMFPFLEEQDMWNDRARRASRNRSERVRAAEERERQRESEERVGEFNERWKSVNSTSISVKRQI